MIESGMGVGRLSWQEIQAWLCIRNRQGHPPLSPWEIDVVRSLSEEYATEYNAASAKDRPPPYAEVVEDENVVQEFARAKIANNIKDAMRSLRHNKDTPKYEVEEHE